MTVRIAVSSNSTVVSVVGSSVTVAVELPAGMLTVPEVALKVAAPVCV